MHFIPVIISVFLFTGLQASWAESYSESHDETGKPRPPYQAFHRRTGIDALHPSPDLVERFTLGHPLGDKIHILPIPFVLDQREYQERIAPGVEQRALALRLFFADLVLGKQEAIRGGRGFIPKELVENVFRENGWGIAGLRELWKGKRLSDVNFTYGPDLVGDAQGRKVVLEDNTGNVGGKADLEATQKAFASEFGPSIFPQGLPESDFEAAIKAFAAQHGGAVVALIGDLKGDFKAKAEKNRTWDLENLREYRLLKKLGIHTLNADKLTARHKAALASGAVRGLINLQMPERASEQLWLLQELFQNKNVAFFQAPGTDIPSSKALLPYVEKMIRYYLNEEPLLRTQPTQLLTSDFKGDPRQYVLKSSSGKQGDEVFLFQKQEGKSYKDLIEWVEDFKARSRFMPYPSLWVMQRYVEPSHIRTPWMRYLVDLRPITYVLGDDIRVARVPWGRSSARAGSGKNNVSQEAFEAVVILESCEALLTRKRAD